MWRWKPLVCDGQLVWSGLHQTTRASKLVTTPVHPELVLKSKVVSFSSEKWNGATCQLQCISRRSYLTHTMDTRQAGAKLKKEKITVYKMFPGVIRVTFECLKHKHWQNSPQAFQGLAQHTKLASSIRLPWKYFFYRSWCKDHLHSLLSTPSNFTFSWFQSQPDKTKQGRPVKLWGKFAGARTKVNQATTWVQVKQVAEGGNHLPPTQNRSFFLRFFLYYKNS